MNEKLNQFTLVIVPASNNVKTEKRFKVFCEKLSQFTGIINGYDTLINNDLIRDPIHKSSNRLIDLRKFIKINNLVNGKSLIVVDDVRTTGKSSNVVYDLLKENGAKDIIFVYFGKTVGLT